MLLKYRVVSLPRAKEGVEAVSQSQEDAWLNDVGPSPQSSTESKSEAAQSSPTEIQAVIEHTPPEQPPTAQGCDAKIVPGHPLWSLILLLSERIWQEISQRSGSLSIPDALLTKFVQKRAIDMLRAEPTLVQQLRDVAQAELILQNVVHEVLGLGPLETLMQDEKISEIMVVGPRFAYVEREGKIEDVECFFEDDRHMLRIVENILRKTGRKMVSDWPIVDVRLPDGSLVNVVMPPSAVNGPTITIRKGTKKPLTVDGLIAAGTLSQEMADFLRACIQARLNIVICGGIKSGRTMLLNALSAFIPVEERITTIEEVAELRLSQKHVVALVSQLAGAGGTGGVTLRNLVGNALRVGSERILLGECRGDEVVEMLQAMNNGYSGFLMTLYANDLRNCLSRLETMYMAADPTLPMTMVRTQIATALDVIVRISRLRDGSHKILNIAEVQSMEKDAIKLQSIFHFKDASFDNVTGELKRTFEPSGFCPAFLPKFEAMGIHLPPDMFKLRSVSNQKQ